MALPRPTHPCLATASVAVWPLSRMARHKGLGTLRATHGIRPASLGCPSTDPLGPSARSPRTPPTNCDENAHVTGVGFPRMKCLPCVSPVAQVSVLPGG